MKEDQLIVALDFSSLEDAKKCVLNCGSAVTYYKVGMELYYAAGNEIISFLNEQRKRIFLDLKLFDIPNTVARALKGLTRLGVDMVNVHASGGLKMMQEAAKSIREQAASLGKPAPKIIAVTVLTSMDEAGFAALNHTHTIAEQVVSLAKLAKEAGLDGVVASPKEALLIREACGSDFLIVTPGVRPAGAAVNDQSRITTPAQAIRNGANHIVVGRPVTQAENPFEAAQAIQQEISQI